MPDKQFSCYHFTRASVQNLALISVYLWLLTTATPFMGPWGPAGGVCHVNDTQSQQASSHLGLATDLRR
jgi:hypothetical protein